MFQIADSVDIILSFAGSKIIARHELLLEALGHVFPEEEYSYQLVSKLSWILPVVVFCAGLVDLILVGTYLKYGLPWKDIISKKKMPKSQFPDIHEDSVDSVTQNNETTL